ncbi:hypothetical protein [Streptomyces iranensis]|uniref:hypothetical protein n=1 Tax=Streptomyces iranensis TaxID=576784 RepID=UPI0039B75F6D
MSKKAKGDKASRGREVIVIAGEHTNDRKIVTHLVRGLCPGLRVGIEEIRDDVRLKEATGDRLTQRVQTLVRKAKAKALSKQANLSGLIVHEDLDGVTDDRYETVRKALANSFQDNSPCPSVVALAAWESEAWLLLFPAAFTYVHRSWHIPASLSGRDTGRIASPKEELQQKIGSPKFREDDGPKIMAAAREHHLLNGPHGSNRSYADFVADLDAWR